MMRISTPPSGAPAWSHGPDASVRAWLLDADPAIRWQVLRDIEGAPAADVEAERDRVASSGWGADLLARQSADGLWGGGIYSPKWTSTTYTLLLLRSFGLRPRHPAAVLGCRRLVDAGLYHDGGINFFGNRKCSEACVTGFVLSLLASFETQPDAAEQLVDYLLREQMPDGGWNCLRHEGATHSSFHTSINVLEGLRDYARCGGPSTRRVVDAEARGREFFLAHRLYRSHQTGEVVRPEFTRFSFPPRWHHDVMRTLDCFRAAEARFDPRLEDPMGLLLSRCDATGRWKLQNDYAGQVHFRMEQVGQPSRWNTLRGWRIAAWWRRCLNDAAAPESR